VFDHRADRWRVQMEEARLREAPALADERVTISLPAVVVALLAGGFSVWLLSLGYTRQVLIGWMVLAGFMLRPRWVAPGGARSYSRYPIIFPPRAP
jgi:hypothetical protein